MKAQADFLMNATSGHRERCNRKMREYVYAVKNLI